MDRGLRGEPSGGPPLSVNSSYDRLATRSTAQQEEDDEDEILEQDPEGEPAISSHPASFPVSPATRFQSCRRPSRPPAGRFSRYGQVIGSGRFKCVYKAFDERRGVDVAWSKIAADANHLSREQMLRAVEEMSTGLALDHPSVIKSYQCWVDANAGCINMITEYLTSGNLRDYRHRHKSLDVKAVKKWARQILQGLAYLHQRDPPVVHGDLRVDKIYINGHSGEIKIGDLGLKALVPRRFAPGVMPEGEDPSNQYTRAVDIFAFGLVMLELVTLKRTDRHLSVPQWGEMLATVSDESLRAFIAQCLSPAEERPTAEQLLKDPFLQPASKGGPQSGGSSGIGIGIGGSSIHGSMDGGDMRRSADGLAAGLEDRNGGIRLRIGSGGGEGGASVARRSTEDQQRAECEPGTVRGEDYLFHFTGKIRAGKLHFRLNMQFEGDDGEGGPADVIPGSSKTIDFVYDPDMDTPDEIAAEISSEFNLSPTDCDICAAALKEWLADQADQDEPQQ